jgi:hypothetical protein
MRSASAAPNATNKGAKSLWAVLGKDPVPGIELEWTASDSPYGSMSPLEASASPSNQVTGSSLATRSGGVGIQPKAHVGLSCTISPAPTSAQTRQMEESVIIMVDSVIISRPATPRDGLHDPDDETGQLDSKQVATATDAHSAVHSGVFTSFCNAFIVRR